MSAETQATGGVAAIVVTYHPDLARLRQLLDALALQVACIYVVDNTGDASFWQVGDFERRATLIPLDGNRGIAAAQNIGARAALKGGAEFVLFLDQDSVPAPDMVSRLVAAWRSLTAEGCDVAAVGPRTLGRSGPMGFIRFGWLRYRAVQPLPSQHWVASDMLNSSGSLITSEAFMRVGDMDESLFIDKVDTEWCLRASAKGMKLFGIPDATLDHRFGHQDRRVWIFGWRRFAVNQPFRYYYIFRNSVLVRRMPHATKRWRRVDSTECVKSLVYFGLASRQRWANLKMIARGVVDGLRGMSGPLRP